jgi:hypothetical protein
MRILEGSKDLQIPKFDDNAGAAPVCWEAELWIY